MTPPVAAVPSLAYGLVAILLITPLIGFLTLQIPFSPREFRIGLTLFACMPTTLTSGVTMVGLVRTLSRPTASTPSSLIRTLERGPGGLAPGGGNAPAFKAPPISLRQGCGRLGVLHSFDPCACVVAPATYGLNT
jgi:hypothetical protein